MDPQVTQFLQTNHLTKADLQNLLQQAPFFDTITFADLTANCQLLCDFGYPTCDFDFLLLNNPAIFVTSFHSLKGKLTQLTTNIADLETALKADPFLL